MPQPLKFEEQLLDTGIAAWEHSESDKGQIYTRPEVVEFMLSAIGLNSFEDFKNARILEPSCGEGEFVVAIVKRLINQGNTRPSIKQLEDKLLAVDLVGSSLDITKNKVASILEAKGYSAVDVASLLNNWFLSSDFLLEDIGSKFTHVIGNPPYVRVENIPKNILEKYRKNFSTMTDRADLYIPFYEKSLSLLVEGGKLSFICTDRWTKNVYGKSLRRFISENYSLELFIDLYGVDAFEKKVMTYPAITQILKGKNDFTVLKHNTNFSQDEAEEILSVFKGESTALQVRKGIVDDLKPWLLGSSDQMALIRKLENGFPLLEETGCKVFIGAATGSNKVYILDRETAHDKIEKDRLLPVITANELKTGSIEWRGKYLINTYDENGVIALKNYPKLASYLNENKEALSNRHVAKKDKVNWFKTIDRVYEDRANMEKLLIPDISSEAIVLHDKGDYHPNNSIYYICSNGWDLHALRVILLSNITKIFISAYSTKIANGYLRFQAQHLRKLCLPYWSDIDENLKVRLIAAGKSDEIGTYAELACEIYNLNDRDREIVGI